MACQNDTPLELKDFLLGAKTLRGFGMLTGPATHLTNALMNLYKSIEQPGITLGTAIADVAKVATGVQKERKAFFGEALVQIQGQLSQAFGANAALPAGLREFAHEIRNSKEFVNNKDYLGKLVAAIPNKTARQVFGVVPKAANLVFGMLSSVDNFFFNVNYAGGMYKQAYLKAMKEGKALPQALKELGENLGKFDKEAIGIAREVNSKAEAKFLEGREIEDLLIPEKDFLDQNKDEIKQLARQYAIQNTPASIAEAKLGAERSIFVARENKRLDQALDTLDVWDKNLNGAISLPLPFRRTPANIVREGLRSSPFGFLPIAARAMGKDGMAELGTRASSQLIGQAIFGTMAFYALWQHVQNGNIKGTPGGLDPNKAHRDTRNAIGEKPGSIQIQLFGRNYVVPLERFNPLGASIDALLKHKQDLDNSKTSGVPLDVIHKSGAAIAWDLTTKLGIGDFARNVGDVLDAVVASPEMGIQPAAKNYLNQLGASLVPALLRQARASAGEPYLKPSADELPGVAGFKAAAGIAGEQRVGLFGDTSRHTTRNPVAAYLSGGTFGEVKNDPVIRKMIEVGAYHQAPDVPDILGKRNQKEQVAFQIGKGRLQRQFVERQVLNPGFASLNAEAQKRLINKAFNNASELANKRAKAILQLKGVISENVIFKGHT